MSNSRVSKYWDHVQQPKLTNRNEILVMEMHVEEKEVLAYNVKSYENAQKRLAEELACGLNGSQKIIARCNDIITRLAPEYQKYLQMKELGLVR